jgi:type II secretory pathway component PulJ
VSSKVDGSAVRALAKRTAELQRAMTKLEQDFQELLGRYRHLNDLIEFKLGDFE